MSPALAGGFSTTGSPGKYQALLCYLKEVILEAEEPLNHEKRCLEGFLLQKALHPGEAGLAVAEGRESACF